MLNRKTLFILGAGASADAAKFPTGIKLAEQISKYLDFRFGDEGLESGDQRLFVNMRRTFQRDINDWQAAAWRIRDGIILSNSIDDFLHIRKTDEHMQIVGKAAIARLILEAERNSPLFIDGQRMPRTLDLIPLRETWLVKFMRILSAGITEVESIFDSVSFIVFNYDRCLEQFLFHAVQQQYGLDANEAARLLQKLTIIHPYGQVGPLQTNLGQHDALPFGGHGEGFDDYLRLSQSIKTYTEEIFDDQERDRIRAEVAKAQCLVFLGFGFHPANMTLLRSGKPYSHKPVFATAYGVSESNTDSISQVLLGMIEQVRRGSQQKYGSIIVAPQAKCSNLLDDFQRVITGI